MMVRVMKAPVFLLLFLCLPKTSVGADWRSTGNPVPPEFFDGTCWLCVELSEPDVYLWATGGDAVCEDEEDHEHSVQP
jgi:hypothetical protein